MLGRRFLLLVVLAIAAYAAGALLLYQSTAGDIEADVAAGLRSDAMTYRTLIELKLEESSSLHQSVAEQLAAVDDNPALLTSTAQSLLESTELQSHGIRSINVLAPEGNTIVGNQPELAPETLAEGRVEVTFGEVIRSANEARLVVAGPVDDQRLLILEQDFGEYEAVLNGYRTSGDTAEAVLTRRVGSTAQFLSVTRYPLDPTAPTAAGAVDGATLLANAVSMNTQDYRDESVVVAFTGVTGTPWTLSTKIDQAEAREPLADLRRNLGWSALLALTVLGLPAAFVHQRSQQRVDRMMAATNSLRGGEFDARVDDGGRDPLGRLAASIDDMAESLANDRLARSEAEADLADQAARDSLTGLPNRVAFMRHLDQQLAMAEPGSVAVLFCDLDGFKAVNDGIGHSAGDKLLAAVAERFKQALRRNDYLARFGGDEFILLCNATGNLDRPRALAARLEKELADPVVVGPIGIDANVSIGMAINGPSDTVDLLVRNADLAMYRIKEQRKSAGLLQRPDSLYGGMGQDTELKEAIANGQLRLLYQPIVNLKNNAIVGVEALVRWHHPMLGLLSPDAFLPRADRGGLLGELDFWVFERACNQAAAWIMAGRIDSSFTMSVNLSPAQLSNPALHDHVASVIERHNIDPAMLQIEITEHSLVIDDVRVSTSLDQLRQLGVRLAIDDFGTLHANLDRVKRLSAGTLKIDQSFVANIVTDSDDRAIIEAVLRLAERLDLRTVAEGIETAEQARVLLELGCECGQGYYFGNPRSPDATAHLLSNGLILL